MKWIQNGWVFTESNWPNWVKDKMWAPEMHFVNGRYLVYFTGGGMDERLASGVAVSQTESPYGPYKDLGYPLIKSPFSLGGAIDPHYFKDPVTDRDYLLWKADQPFSLKPSLIYIRELWPNGTSFKVQ